MMILSTLYQNVLSRETSLCLNFLRVCQVHYGDAESIFICLIIDVFCPLR